MAELTRFAWAVLESAVRKHAVLGQPLLVSKCDPKVAQELIDAGLLEKRAYGRPKGYLRGQASALWPTDAGKKLLAERRAGVQP